MKYNLALDPFCNTCGKYKGVGSCKNPNCKAYQLNGMKGQSDSKTIDAFRLSGIRSQCYICMGPAVVSCGVCKQGYCESHSIGMNKSNLHHKNQHIGTCSRCQSYVCEKCWILDTSGSIVCLNHLEETENSADE